MIRPLLADYGKPPDSRNLSWKTTLSRIYGEPNPSFGRKGVLTYLSLEMFRGGQPVGLNPNIRIYRYSKGQYFDCHCMHYLLVSTCPRPKDLPTNLCLLLDDDSNYLTLDSVPVKTTWTLLLYLTSSTEGCVGGETVFYPHDRKSAAEEIVVSLETGMLLLHKHGDDCLLVSRLVPCSLVDGAFPFLFLLYPPAAAASSLITDTNKAKSL